ncbi:SDR family oxidoreductase [Rhizobium sp. TRM95111]|uniref:SDR family oxidoreductase n=1 Tax=Rhizobium alarense TaxID=2846851 RepID=UPI001F4424D9|nr:SDR family oxidoreductase [Rhizobium alarense]MCF3640789.1 SDR family oxidoreductase [Rhizobium alarense]
MKQLLILGAGFSGRAIAKAFMDTGAAVYGTTRSAEKADQLAGLGITPLLYDGETLSAEVEKAMAATTHLVQSIAPGALGDPMFRDEAPRLETLFPALRWAAYLSTVGVYGDHKGNWVDETAELHPVSSRSVERVDAERRWLDWGRAQGLPVAVLRLSGIYGPGRNAFCNIAAGTARRLIKDGQVFNRIRVEDIGSAAVFLAERKLGGIFNITDHEPGPPQDVVAEAAALMGADMPPEIPFEMAELSPMARSFWGENKRVSNRKIRDLGFRFRYPDYRQSLEQLWKSGIWRG